MGLFSTILEKLGLKKDKAAAPAAGPAKPAASEAPTKPAPTVSAPKAAPAAPAAAAAKHVPAAAPKMDEVVAAPKAISEVDVVAHLEQLAAANPAKLNWKVSIVDLLKLLDLESSLEARKELATELGCPADQMSDSARMNVWLHKTVLKKIAENGGNIPADLLD